ncbi:MAG: hypothetical protein KBB55_01055 [Candidatus Buchananbacteria bacterium]|jgi:hypothetical protein|nr:hypothetical protein [Candidatus Buchananbacteria bacterium]
MFGWDDDKKLSMLLYAIGVLAIFVVIGVWETVIEPAVIFATENISITW